MIEVHSNRVTAPSSDAASASARSEKAGATALAPPCTDILVTVPDRAVTLGITVHHGERCGVTLRPRRPRPRLGYSRPYTSPRPRTSSPKSSTSSTSSKSASTSKSSSASKTSGPLGFLNDPKLSVEDKLFKFMCYVADKYDKAIEKKLNEIAGKENGTSSGSASKKSGGGGLLGGLLGGKGGGGGLLGGILGGVGGLLGGGGGLAGLISPVLSAAGMAVDVLKSSGVQNLVTQLSGPVLAAGASACGFPMLAPLLLKAGPALTQGAFGVLDAATGSAADAKAGGSASSSSSSSSSTSGEPKIEQKDMLELQRLQDKQKEMFSLVSNMLRSMHDTKMAVINNLRV